MLENAAAMATQSPADATPMRRQIVRIDGRSKASKRAKQLARCFAAAIGNVTDTATMARIERAAELATLGEQMRGRALRGAEVDLGLLLRIEGLADRAVRALGINAKAPAAPGLSLAEYLRANHGGGDNAENGPGVPVDSRFANAGRVATPTLEKRTDESPAGADEAAE